MPRLYRCFALTFRKYGIRCYFPDLEIKQKLFSKRVCILNKEKFKKLIEIVCIFNYFLLLRDLLLLKTVNEDGFLRFQTKPIRTGCVPNNILTLYYYRQVIGIQDIERFLNILNH